MQPPLRALARLRRWLRVVLACGAAAGLHAGAGAEPVVYTLDPDASFVHFEIVHFGTSTIRGRFGPVAGEVTLDRSAGSGAVGVRIATAAVNTGLPIFDARVRRGDLLASDEYPEAYFVASRFRWDGDRLAEVNGEFTLRGVSQPLVLRALRFGCHRAPDSGREVCGGDFSAEFDRSAYGMTFGLGFVADRVRVIVQVEGRRRDP